MGLYDGSIGAFVLGTMLNVFLLGVTATQAFYYYQTFPNDKKIYWWLVTILLVLDWLHSAVSCYTIYDWTVTHYGDLAHLAVSPWSFAIDPALCGIVASIVQVFYAYRVYVVSKKRVIIPILICLFSAIQLGFSCGATGMIFHLQSFSRFQEWTYGVVCWLVAAAIADVLITCSLVYYLVNSKTGIVQTNSLINKLIEVVIENNALTGSAAIIDAVLFSVLPTSWHVTVNLCLVKLYFNSFLVSLNARAGLEKHLQGARAFSAGHLTSSHGQHSQSHPSGASNASSTTLMTASGFTAGGSPRSLRKPHRDMADSGGILPIHVLTQQTIKEETVEKGDYDRFHHVNQKSRKRVPDDEESFDSAPDTLMTPNGSPIR